MQKPYVFFSFHVRLISVSIIIDGNFEKHLEVKRQIETLRARYGEEGWLHGDAASEVQNLLNIDDPPFSSLKSDGIPTLELNSKTSVNVTKVNNSSICANVRVLEKFLFL